MSDLAVVVQIRTNSNPDDPTMHDTVVSFDLIDETLPPGVVVNALLMLADGIIVASTDQDKELSRVDTARASFFAVRRALAGEVARLERGNDDPWDGAIDTAVDIIHGDIPEPAPAPEPDDSPWGPLEMIDLSPGTTITVDTLTGSQTVSGGDLPGHHPDCVRVPNHDGQCALPVGHPDLLPPPGA